MQTTPGSWTYPFLASRHSPSAKPACLELRVLFSLILYLESHLELSVFSYKNKMFYLLPWSPCTSAGRLGESSPRTASCKQVSACCGHCALAS